MRIMTQAILFITIGFLMLVAADDAAAQDPAPLDREKQVEIAIRAEMKEKSIAGATVAVFQRGKVALIRGFGLANIELSIAAAANTRYQIGSATKPFTAIAILMLVEDGKVSLDEKTAKYLSELPAQYSEI